MLTARHRVDERTKEKPTRLRLKQYILLRKSRRFWILLMRPDHERLHCVLKTHSEYTCNCQYVHALLGS